MKVSINQVKINRVGINTAQVRGIRLSSAVADRGHKVDFPFSDSLVDYWNFGGKSNFDKDRTTVTGLLGNVLTAYNFGWSLMSGYGGYNENYLKYKKAANVFVTDDHSITIMNFVPANTFVAYQYDTDHIKATKVRVTGLTATDQLTYEYLPSDGGSRAVFPIPEDGEYDLPESIQSSSGTPGYNVGFAVRNALTKNVTIEQIPLYEGAIVTDGVDDYLKLDKVGYKVGTIIIKFKPINIKPNIVNSILNIHTDEVALQYDTSGVLNNNFTTYKNYGEYSVGTFNIDKNAATPLTLGCKLSNSGSPMEYSNVAIYSVAIYQNVLTDEEIQKEIKVMEYGTPNPVFALNFDNFAYKAVDYPDFATGKVTTNKIVVDSTTETFNGAIAVAMNPEADAGEPIEVPSYKIKVTGLNQYSVGEGNWAVGLMGMMIDSTKDPWTYPISKDGVYDIPAISLSDGIYNLGIMAQIAIDKPIEIEVLYDKNVTKSFPENKQIFP
ncbi:hypothetical protein [Bacteroides fragilis]|uniref:hypothetical protein n=1 Tax=Bacteroides fragilis TaxID=817 RepID=UPI001CE20AC4|nr:hypothetical protein [Bacteroides fragilis]MCA5613021.1 hypothetical protein [Bacteroides fragilis]